MKPVLESGGSQDDRGAWPFRFRCCRSGNCCTRTEGRVTLQAAEVPAVAQALDISLAGLHSRFLDPGPDTSFLVRLAPDGACPWFFKQEGRGSCSIYPARPAHCRSFPYWEELRRDGPALREVMRFCPGIEANFEV